MSTSSDPLVLASVPATFVGTNQAASAQSRQIISAKAANNLTSPIVAANKAVELRLFRNGAVIRLDWESGQGQLEEAEFVDGPWVPTPGQPSSPHPIEPVGRTKFYRIRER